MSDKTVKEVEIRSEEEANQFSIKCMLFTMIGIIVCWIMNYLRIFIVDLKLMNMGLSGILFIIIPVIICRFVDIGKPWVKYMLMFGITGAITVQSISITYHTVIMILLPLFLSLQYFKRSMVYYTYFLAVLGIAASVYGGYYFGLCDANMVVLTTGPTRDYIDAVTGNVHFEMANTQPMITLFMFFVFPRCLLLLLFVPLMHKISESISKNAIRLSEVQHEAEVDTMTSVYNKNKYLNMVSQYYPDCEKVGVIFWDINNLKETNDKMGHHSGDYLITCTAYLLRALIEPNRKVFRVGGDEFVMIVENPKEGEMQNIIERWHNGLHAHRQIEQSSLSAAIGFAVGAGIDIRKVIDEADQAMYENKKKMKCNDD